MNPYLVLLVSAVAPVLVSCLNLDLNKTEASLYTNNKIVLEFYI